MVKAMTVFMDRMVIVKARRVNAIYVRRRTVVHRDIY